MNRPVTLIPQQRGVPKVFELTTVGIAGERCPAACRRSSGTVVYDAEAQTYRCVNQLCRWELGSRPVPRLAYAHVTQLWLEAVRAGDVEAMHHWACRQEEILWDLDAIGKRRD